ncbi:MAG: peptidoglycan bridge formation glycyltransferase FemA/FemB family protein [Candidatus Azambacteria bacterium]|nr:peptidoglycan bridge formation glycyltransferase FemA/FemB family protein [Candidatus Azambacteria bacterium]
MLEIKEVHDKSEYNPLLFDKKMPFTQAWFYGEWQMAMGRKVRRFEVKEDSKIISFFQIIKYPLPFGKNILYIPHASIRKEFCHKLIEIAKEEDAIFVRFESKFVDSSISLAIKKVPSYAYHSVYFQPKYEWVLDIDKSENELLGNMHPKSRYGVRLAENKGIKIEIIENNLGRYFEDFYGLMKETAERNRFKLHPKGYYQNIFMNCEKNENAFLALARYNNKILAINLILLFGETAYFLFGASSNEFKNLMAPHLTHWRGIIEAKNRGYRFYNFGAIAFGNENDSFQGISRFKKRFGGRLLEYPDSYDLILQPLWHWLYKLRKRFQNL